MRPSGCGVKGAGRARSPSRGSRYHLTEAGREVRPIIEAMGFWGKKWVHRRCLSGISPRRS